MYQRSMMSSSCYGRYKNMIMNGMLDPLWFSENNVLGQFRRPSFRPHQKETIVEIAKAFESGYQYVICDAPTGSGKSDIGASFAFASGSAHILTIQKLLQTQYKESFPDMFVMKGRNAYDCVLSDSGESCAKGPCRRKKVSDVPSCPYITARNRATTAPVTVHNFDSFFYQTKYGRSYGGRRLLIVDEAHNITNKFTEFISFTIDSRGGVVVPEADSLEAYDGFIEATLSEYSEEYSKLESLYDLDGLTQNELNKMQDLNQLIQKMRIYLQDRTKDNPIEFVFDFKAKGRNGPNVTFRPVFIGRWAKQDLFSYGERVLLMSATILDKAMFCREVGLNPDEVYYVSVPSTFPVENRPILKKYAGKMSYSEIDNTLPKIEKLITDITAKFPNHKGIIQTHSDKIAAYLQENLKDTRFTFNRDYSSPQDMLDVHSSKEGSFIVASGLREGLDLYGALSKVQIFCKIPYPSLGDKVVKRKMELLPDWYGWITAVMFIQALGRSVRSPNEKAVTFILDSGFGWFYKKNKRFIPDYIREAIHW